MPGPATETSTGPAPFPGAVVPDRQRVVRTSGVGIAVHEWGDEAAPPLLVAHGGFDFARTMDVFAPLLAVGGWRVVAWDLRGHGDSEHAPLYSWDADLRDAGAVIDSVSRGPVAVLGHSRGGALLLRLAEAWPHRLSKLVNLDGLPSRRRMPDASDSERSRMLADDVAAWLDHRRRAATGERKPGTIDELAARRARMNPRLDPAWLRRLVTVGGRHDADGWRWKIDPSLRMGGFGPWRPEWSLQWMPGLPMPILGVLGGEKEPMGFGTTPAGARRVLPADARIEVLAGVGHFVHIEQPALVADLVLDFLGDPR